MTGDDSDTDHGETTTTVSKQHQTTETVPGSSTQVLPVTETTVHTEPVPVSTTAPVRPTEPTGRHPLRNTFNYEPNPHLNPSYYGPVPTASIPAPASPAASASSGSSTPASTPATGEQINFLPVILLLLSTVTAVGAFKARKRDEDDED